MQKVEWRRDLTRTDTCNLCIDRCRLEAQVAEQVLNKSDINAMFEQMGGKGVSQAVARRRFGEVAQAYRPRHPALGRARTDVAFRILRRGEHEIAPPSNSAQASKKGQQALGKRHHPVAPSFALNDLELAAVDIEIAETHAHAFGNTHSCCIEQRQQQLLLHRRRRKQKALYCFRRKHCRKLLRSTRRHKPHGDSLPAHLVERCPQRRQMHRNPR